MAQLQATTMIKALQREVVSFKHKAHKHVFPLQEVEICAKKLQICDQKYSKLKYRHQEKPPEMQ